MKNLRYNQFPAIPKAVAACTFIDSEKNDREKGLINNLDGRSALFIPMRYASLLCQRVISV